MARPFTGYAHLDAARELCHRAKSVKQMRQALAVLLPLEAGLTLEQTAAVLGRTREATCRLRMDFINAQEGRTERLRPVSTARAERHQAQAAALDELLPTAAEGGVVVVPQLKPLLEKRLGKTLCLATIYNMLHRHGWRKLAPDTAHPKGDAAAREAWKKNSPPRWQKFEPSS
ncbi:MAG: winged helix-turn-helix domain-containing protein [Burkholderiales bacterium]|nr:MAG: winged helix-turn-helix domain-containing protein [Burkholderiales bacterium]